MAEKVELTEEFDDLPDDEKQKLLELAGALEQAERRKALAEAEYGSARKALTEAQLEAKIKKFAGPDDDHQIIQSSSSKLDVVRLRKALTAEQWAACTEPVFSSEKLAAAVQAKTIRGTLVRKFTTPTYGNPYIKSTARKK